MEYLATFLHLVERITAIVLKYLILKGTLTHVSEVTDYSAIATVWDTFLYSVIS